MPMHDFSIASGEPRIRPKEDSIDGSVPLPFLASPQTVLTSAPTSPAGHRASIDGAYSTQFWYPRDISPMDEIENRRADIVTAKTDHPESSEDLKAVSMADLQTKLGSTVTGLTQAEAQKRLAQYGPNQIEEKKTNEYLKFLSYFWGPIPWMIEAAVILSGVVRHWLDFFVILVLLLSNALVGFWEEHQAGNAIAALKARDR